jgi:DNA-binding MarR family transcriptional regulator
MASEISADWLLTVLRDTIVGTVRRAGPDMSARQFALFMICYIEPGPHTVRGLAARLDISKPAVTRSLDRLEELSMAKRGPDPRDRRSVLVLRTRRGQDFLNELQKLLVASARQPAPGVTKLTARRAAVG